MLKDLWDEWWNKEFESEHSPDDGYISSPLISRKWKQILGAIFSGIVIACISNNIGTGILGGLLTLWLVDD